MGSSLPILHLIFDGVWLGCVLTEIAFEKILLAGGREQHVALARIHKWVDLAIETPAFIGVAATGLLLLPASPSSVALSLKIACAAVAVAANLYCAALVLRRCKAAETGDWPAFDRLDRSQHRIGAVVLLGLLASLALGLYLSL